MESTIVIKVKYGETLRRMNARVNESGQLDLNMDGLREKVLCLFNLAPEADVTLTYIDEDGDVVTLVEEEDLRDVMRQSLNPLRIAVKLNDKSGRFYNRSSGSSTPMRSPRVQHPFPNLDRSVSQIVTSVPAIHEAIDKLPKVPNLDRIVSEILKSVPETICEALDKLSHDVASKASSTMPGFAAPAATFVPTPVLKTTQRQPGTINSKFSELFDIVSKKVGQSNINLPSEVQAGTESSTQGGASGSAVGASMNKEPEASKDDLAALEMMTNANQESTNNTNQRAGLGGKNVAEALVTPVNLNAGLPGSEKKKVGKSNHPWKSISAGASASTADYLKSSTMDFKNTNWVGSPSTMFPGLNYISECPFAGMPVATDSAGASVYKGFQLPSFKRSHDHSEGLSGVFHRGIRCDGCGVYPITGPRFNSKVKENYDLCSVCFSEVGNEAEYTRMDCPVYYRHPYSRKGLCDPMQNHCVHSQTLPPHLRGSDMQPSRPKLDSRFILDVNVLDDTIMDPSTPFTKIWRIRNNGTMVWPQGTQLVWIGGEKLSNALSVELQISSYGLAVDNELDVAVDFTAPELPGRYISYWRMAAPSGQKFGQRIWVLIQVDASLKDSISDSFCGLNLNLPPASTGTTGLEMVNVNVESMKVEDSLGEPDTDKSNKAAELVEPIVDSHPTDPEQNFPINDTLLVGGGVSKPITPEVPTSVSYPVIDMSEVAPVVPSHEPSPSADLPAASGPGASENDDVEQTLLKELGEMGFKEVALNKEILRMNEYNLERSVDELCGVAEWDPILEELQEMGFCDNETNKMLLKKNGGSIKRVVMDLIAGEKM